MFRFAGLTVFDLGFLGGRVFTQGYGAVSAAPPQAQTKLGFRWQGARWPYQR
jgi:hypothetical protein